jgi:glutathione synthase/RimK-type ligase-like ATP-grasp enzyme
MVNVMKRSATKKGDFKANLSTGGQGEPATLSTEDEKLCIRAAAADPNG